MYNGKNKAITFSYDDGVTQDVRLIEILDKYNLKATFNINSELLGQDRYLMCGGKKVSHRKIDPKDIKTVYKNHEVAAHTLTHPNLTGLSDEEIVVQVEQDRKNLERLTGRDVVGMAYPCGGTNFDERVAAQVRNNTGIKYARTIISSHGYEPQTELFTFKPSVYHMETEKMFEMGEEFVKMKPDKPMLFYIWGHSYEFDIDNTWDKFEEFCKIISGHNDIFYGTNREIFGL